MILTEHHIISKNKPEWKRIDELSFLSKNLYNACLWSIKNHFDETGLWLRFNEMYRKFYDEKNPYYFALPSATSQQIMMLMDKNMKSYFALLKMYRKNKNSLNGCPHFPKFKHPVKGRNVVIFRCDQPKLKDGYIIFPKRSGLSPVKTEIKGNIRQVRLLPQSSCYVIEIAYEKEVTQTFPPNDSWMSIDLGVDNLMTCFNTVGSKPIIVSGKPLKHINQYWNKKKANLQSELSKKQTNRKTSKRIQKLTQKRNRKVKDYIHKSSRLIINTCLESNISNIVIGYNKEWKQNVSMGDVNNQNFVQLPYLTLIKQIEYKAALLGISVLLNEESYTSKCSSMDLEIIKKHKNYKGQRPLRGMFISETGHKINADLNGAINILRKVIGDKGHIKRFVQTQSDRGQVVWPFQVKLNK